MGTRQRCSLPKGKIEKKRVSPRELYTGRAAEQESEVALITERTRPTVTSYPAHQLL